MKSKIKTMEITTELLKKIYARAIQFHITKYGKEPDYIMINEYGHIEAMTKYYRGDGDTDEDINIISVEELSADLEVVAAERIQREEEARRVAAIKREEERIAKEKADKERRRYEYLKLQKEFGVN